MSNRSEWTVVKQYLQDPRGAMRAYGGYGYFRLLLTTVDGPRRKGASGTKVLRVGPSVPNRGMKERSGRVQQDKLFDCYREEELRKQQGVDDMTEEILADYLQEF